MRRRVLVVAIGLLTLSSALYAHHASGVSYQTDKPWTAKVVVVDFKYINPHPLMSFTITDEQGRKVLWNAELAGNASRLVRAGWGKKRSEDALKPGTTVTLRLATAKAGGPHAIVQGLQNEKGEEILTDGPAPAAGAPGAPAAPRQ